MVQLSISCAIDYDFLIVPGEPDSEQLTVNTTFMVRLMPAFPPTIVISPIPTPIVAPQVPLMYTFSGTASAPQGPLASIQYKVEKGQFANAINVNGNWTQWKVSLPLPPTTTGHDHVLTLRATDVWGTMAEVNVPFVVDPQPPVVFPPGAKTTLSGGPSTSSVTSWTRLEPQCFDADMVTSSSARVFDPLWLLTRQWQTGEFQAEDTGTPVQARVRASAALLTRCYSGELPTASGGTSVIPAPTYDPKRTPLEVLVERRPMRATNENDARMLTFAVESGLHFLRMLEQQTLTQNYRSAFLTKLALQRPAPEKLKLLDDASARYVESMTGRAPDGRQLATLLRTIGTEQLVQGNALAIAVPDWLKVQQTLNSWLTWYDSMVSEPSGATDNGWNGPRLEYAVSVGARLSATTGDSVTLSASEIDGPMDWSSFDVNTSATLSAASDQGFTSIVQATVPAPVNFPGAPAPRFWEMEDARLAYGLMPVGPTDLAHLMMIEYASTYGNDWFIVPLTLPVGSITRIESLVVTDTFGVRNLIRPIGDPALPPPNFSLWQSALLNPSLSVAQKNVTNRFFLPPTLARTLDSAPLEEVLFMRDEMANLAWAIERTVESPIEQPAQRYEAPDATPTATEQPDSEATDSNGTPLPRYLLSTTVPPNWIPLLPVQVSLPPPPPVTTPLVSSHLKRGAVLQPDGSKQVHTATSDVLLSLGSEGMLFDEEVPREGTRVTRQRRLARWTDGSTWLWTSFRNQVGQGEGASQLRFDQILDPGAE
jgi:hypothetical protein